MSAAAGGLRGGGRVARRGDATACKIAAPCALQSCRLPIAQAARLARTSKIHQAHRVRAPFCRAIGGPSNACAPALDPRLLTAWEWSNPELRPYLRPYRRLHAGVWRVKLRVSPSADRPAGRAKHNHATTAASRTGRQRQPSRGAADREPAPGRALASFAPASSSAPFQPFRRTLQYRPACASPAFGGLLFDPAPPRSAGSRVRLRVTRLAALTRPVARRRRGRVLTGRPFLR